MAPPAGVINLAEPRTITLADETLVSSSRTRLASAIDAVAELVGHPFNDDTTGNPIRRLLGGFDEYRRHNNATHTPRAMQENASQTAALAKATINGGLPPAAGVVPSFVRGWRAGCDKNENWQVTLTY